MAMTAKERLLTALNKGKPDRVPATVHQWQPYHLKYFMGGKSDLEAFREVGLDAAITLFPPLLVQSPTWIIRSAEKTLDGNQVIDYQIDTPEGSLTYQVGYNEVTSWVTIPMIKKDEDIYLIKKYRPIPQLDKGLVQRRYDEIGDDGILRTFVFGEQGGCWQDACVLCGTEELIFATYDKPEWVHELLEILLQQKFQYIEESLKGARVDLIETGGGAASNNVISPKLHAEFCMPYDRRMHDAIHQAGHKAVYHTCGGMMQILDLILQNHCDASETLSPPGVGGDITEPTVVKQIMGDKVCLIGGLDQFNILEGPDEGIRREVFRLFEQFGPNGGYIMSASDHFFHTPKDKIICYAKAAQECLY